LLSELAFGSLLTYSPRGGSEVSQRSRRICYNLKAGDPQTLLLVGQRLRDHVSRGEVLESLLGPDVTLVPMPRSAPLVSGALWPAQKICDAIIQVGLAAQSTPVLERVTAVTKSAGAGPGERPHVSQHYESLRASVRIDVSHRIVLIDDVLTKGSTAIAAASRLAEAYPNTQITLFSVIRTKGMVPEIEQILDPAVGTIRVEGDEVDRQP
jgi:hypothetical protein